MTFDTGIWRKEIHRRSGNMPQQEFDKILKSLESKKLVKQVSSVQVSLYNNFIRQIVLCVFGEKRIALLLAALFIQ